jgi:hypothetical protein
VASLLVYVDAARLQALLPGPRVPGATWAIGHGELEDLGAPPRVADRQRGLIARLGAMFSQVVPNAGASASLTP